MAYRTRRTSGRTRYGIRGRAAAPARRSTGRRSTGRARAPAAGVNTLRIIMEQTGAGLVARPETGTYPFAPPARAKKMTARR